MKTFFLGVLFAGISLSTPAGSFGLEGESFQGATNIEIVWNAPTNTLPRNLWIYKIMPEAISAAVVSNAMKIGHFSMTDLSQPPDKNLISFKNNNEANLPRWLYIAPTIGGIEYSSRWDFKTPDEAIPTSDEAEQLARDILFQLGVDRSLLSDKVQKGYDDVTTKYDRNHHQKGTPQVTRRGVVFARQLDGVSLAPASCLRIFFRSHGTIEGFTFQWRNLMPYESYRAVTPAEILRIIKSGKAVLPDQYYDLTGLEQAKKLTVVKVTPRYYNGVGDEVLEFLRPYAEIEMVADVGETNKITFVLRSSILGGKIP